jgi:hypothetical protein
METNLSGYASRRSHIANLGVNARRQLEDLLTAAQPAAVNSKLGLRSRSSIYPSGFDSVDKFSRWSIAHRQWVLIGTVPAVDRQ